MVVDVVDVVDVVVISFLFFSFLLTCGFVSRTWLLDLCYRASSLEWAVVRVRRDNGAVQDVKL